MWAKDDVCEVYTVYMGLCIYLYIPYIYIYLIYAIYSGEERERENKKKTFPTASNHRHSTASESNHRHSTAQPIIDSDSDKPENLPVKKSRTRTRNCPG